MKTQISTMLKMTFFMMSILFIISCEPEEIIEENEDVTTEQPIADSDTDTDTDTTSNGATTDTNTSTDTDSDTDTTSNADVDTDTSNTDTDTSSDTSTSITSDLDINITDTYDIESNITSTTFYNNDVLNRTSVHLASSNSNLYLDFNGLNLHEGEYSLVNSVSNLNDSTVYIYGSVKSSIFSSNKSFTINADDIGEKKLLVSKNEKGDWLLVLSETAIGGYGFETTLEFKASFNFDKIVSNVDPEIESTSFTRITNNWSGVFIIGDEMLTLYLPLSNDELRASTGQHTVELSTLDFLDIDLDDEVYALEYKVNYHPKEGGTLTYEVIDGVFTGTLDNVVVVSGDKEITLNVEFYIVL